MSIQKYGSGRNKGKPKRQIMTFERTKDGRFKKLTSKSVWPERKATATKKDHKQTREKIPITQPIPKKNTYSQYIKTAQLKDKERFFGPIEQVSAKYFTFKHVHSPNEIVIVTSNVKTIKGNYVMVVGNNQAVYLKDWQLKRVRNWSEGWNGYAVKLNRQYYKPYTFKTEFEDFYFKKNETFDDLLNIAKSQDRTNLKVATGWSH